MFEFSTALYELYKREALGYYDNLNKTTYYGDIADIEQGFDDTQEVNVETLIKLFKKHRKGREGISLP